MLERIVQYQHSQVPLFQTKSQGLSIEPSERSLVDALNRKKRGFILECKKASPSKGLMIEAYDPIKLATTFEPFAAAISVLTNQQFFDGAYEHIAQIREYVDCPILCKDIIVTPSQITLARHYGADAVLLMLNVLDDKSYLQCKAHAEQLNLDIITEVHTAQELERALAFDANIIGINHRDFKSLETSFEPTKQLAPLIPKNKIVIAESGINTFADINELSPFSKNFLIGSSLSQSQRPDLKVRELLFNTIKVCGLTSKQDALNAYQLGASYGGLNFVESSPRYIKPTQAKALTTTPLSFVGVFQNHSIERILDVIKECPLQAVQLHGDESLDFVQNLRTALDSDIKIFKAVRVHDIETYIQPYIDKLIVDSEHQGQFGGTGKQVYLERIPSKYYDKIILAGGISPDNIDSLKAYPFAGFDINSQVESSPGNKSKTKLKQFFDKIGSLS